MTYIYLEDILIASFAVVNSLLIASGTAAWINLKYTDKSSIFIKLVASCFGIIPYIGLFLIELADLQQCLTSGGVNSHSFCAFPVGTLRWKVVIFAIPIGFPMAWIMAHLALRHQNK